MSEYVGLDRYCECGTISAPADDTTSTSACGVAYYCPTCGLNLGRRPDGFLVGQRVRTGVWVGSEWRPMALGVVTAVHSGYCEVDIMGLHGGRPWILSYPWSHLAREHEAPFGAGAAVEER